MSDYWTAERLRVLSHEITKLASKTLPGADIDLEDLLRSLKKHHEEQFEKVTIIQLKLIKHKLQTVFSSFRVFMEEDPQNLDLRSFNMTAASASEFQARGYAKDLIQELITGKYTESLNILSGFLSSMNLPIPQMTELDYSSHNTTQDNGSTDVDVKLKFKGTNHRKNGLDKENQPIAEINKYQNIQRTYHERKDLKAMSHILILPKSMKPSQVLKSHTAAESNAETSIHKNIHTDELDQPPKERPVRAVRKPAILDGFGSDSDSDSDSESESVKDADLRKTAQEKRKPEVKESSKFKFQSKFSRDPNIWTPELRTLLALEILNGPPHKKQDKGYNHYILTRLQNKYPELFAEHTPRRIKDLKSKFHQSHVFLKKVLANHGKCFNPETFEIIDDGQLRAEFGKDRKWSCLERFKDPLRILNGYLGGLGDDLIKKYGWKKYFNPDGSVVGDISYKDVYEKAKAKKSERSTIKEPSKPATVKSPIKLTLKAPKKLRTIAPKVHQPLSKSSSSLQPAEAQEETEASKRSGRNKFINSSDNVIRKSKRSNPRIFKGPVSKKRKIIDFIVNTPYHDSGDVFELCDSDPESDDEVIRDSGSRTRKMKISRKDKNHPREITKIRLNEKVLTDGPEIESDNSEDTVVPDLFREASNVLPVKPQPLEYVLNSKPVSTFEQVWKRINSIPPEILKEHNIDDKILDLVSLDFDENATKSLSSKICLDDRRFLLNLTKAASEISQRTL